MDYIFIWDVHPELPFLRQFVPIRYYSLLFTTGLMIAYFIVKHLYQKEGRSIQNLDELALYIFAGIIIGARLGHCFFYEPTYYLNHLLEVFLPIKINGGEVTFVGYRGLASHGGIIGVVLAILWYCRQYKESLLPILDKIAIAGALVGCFIRVGNFMNSEIIGIPTNTNFGVIFKNIDNIPRHPAQLYEAICYLLLFIAVFLFYKNRATKLDSGFIFGLILASVFSIRFLLEFVKINQVAFEEGLIFNMGQLLSLPIVVLGVLVMIFRWRPKAL